MDMMSPGLPAGYAANRVPMVAGQVCLFDIVGSEKDRNPAGSEVPDDLPYDKVALDVESRCRLFEEQEPGVVDKSHCQGKPAFHAF